MTKMAGLRRPQDDFLRIPSPATPSPSNGSSDPPSLIPSTQTPLGSLLGGFESVLLFLREATSRSRLLTI